MLGERLAAWWEDARPPERPPLPEIPAPSLDDLRVVVRAPEPLTPEVLLEEYDRYLLSVAPREARPEGDPVRSGDQVVVALMVFDREGAPIPFTARDGLTVIAEGPCELPGLADALVGRSAEDVFDLPLRFPDAWPSPGLRGMDAVLRVGVRSVVALDLPHPDDEDLLARLGVVMQMEELMEALKARWTDQRAEALAEEGRALTLDALRARSSVEVPRAWIDAEVWARWADGEGRILYELGGTEEELASSFAAWQASSELADDIRAHVVTSLQLRAIAREHAIELEEDDVLAAVEEAAEELEVEPEVLRAALSEDRERFAAVANEAFTSKLVDFVVECAHIEFGG